MVEFFDLFLLVSFVSFVFFYFIMFSYVFCHSTLSFCYFFLVTTVFDQTTLLIISTIERSVWLTPFFFLLCLMIIVLFLSTVVIQRYLQFFYYPLILFVSCSYCITIYVIILTWLFTLVYLLKVLLMRLIFFGLSLFVYDIIR